MSAWSSKPVFVSVFFSLSGQEKWTNGRNKAPSARTNKGVYRDQPYTRYWTLKSATPTHAFPSNGFYMDFPHSFSFFFRIKSTKTTKKQSIPERKGKTGTWFHGDVQFDTGRYWLLHGWKINLWSLIFCKIVNQPIRILLCQYWNVRGWVLVGRRWCKLQVLGI